MANVVDGKDVCGWAWKTCSGNEIHKFSVFGLKDLILDSERILSTGRIAGTGDS